MARVVIAASADADIEVIPTYLADQAGRRTAAKYDACSNDSTTAWPLIPASARRAPPWAGISASASSPRTS